MSQSDNPYSTERHAANPQQQRRRRYSARQAIGIFIAILIGVFIGMANPFDSNPAVQKVPVKSYVCVFVPNTMTCKEVAPPSLPYIATPSSTSTSNLTFETQNWPGNSKLGLPTSQNCIMIGQHGTVALVNYTGTAQMNKAYFSSYLTSEKSHSNAGFCSDVRQVGIPGIAKAFACNTNYAPLGSKGLRILFETPSGEVGTITSVGDSSQAGSKLWRAVYPVLAAMAGPSGSLR
jgi:hypothetical protein